MLAAMGADRGGQDPVLKSLAVFGFDQIPDRMVIGRVAKSTVNLLAITVVWLEAIH